MPPGRTNTRVTAKINRFLITFMIEKSIFSFSILPARALIRIRSFQVHAGELAKPGYWKKRLA